MGQDVDDEAGVHEREHSSPSVGSLRVLVSRRVEDERVAVDPEAVLIERGALSDEVTPEIFLEQTPCDDVNLFAYRKASRGQGSSPQSALALRELARGANRSHPLFECSHYRKTFGHVDPGLTVRTQHYY